MVPHMCVLLTIHCHIFADYGIQQLFLQYILPENRSRDTQSFNGHKRSACALSYRAKTFV